MPPQNAIVVKRTSKSQNNIANIQFQVPTVQGAERIGGDMSAMNEVAEPCHRASDSLANVALRSSDSSPMAGKAKAGGRRKTCRSPC